MGPRISLTQDGGLHLLRFDGRKAFYSLSPCHTIHRRPKEVYERVYAYFHDLEDVNPEEGHYMERLWLTIFAAGGSVQRASGQSSLGKDETVVNEDHEAQVEKRIFRVAEDY